MIEALFVGLTAWLVGPAMAGIGASFIGSMSMARNQQKVAEINARIVATTPSPPPESSSDT